jgi:uncharacterized protein YecT (DUF1311 family)
MWDWPMRGWLDAVLLAGLGLWAANAPAIDNPDGPDLLADFTARAEAYENRIGTSAGSTHEVAAAYGAYERFLDGELDQDYRALDAKLDPPARAALHQSQQRWLAFRDAEFKFIDRNWTQETFGTSAVLSRGAYRTSIVKERSIALLHYLQNYP